MEIYLAGSCSRPYCLIDWYAEGMKEEGRKEGRKCNYIWRGGYQLI